MSEVKTVDLSKLSFSSTVFPTDEDKELWKSLNDEQRRALIEGSEQAGFDSGIAENTSLQALLDEARAEHPNGL